jgi:hypothetical protein
MHNKTQRHARSISSGAHRSRRAITALFVTVVTAAAAAPAHAAFSNLSTRPLADGCPGTQLGLGQGWAQIGFANNVYGTVNFKTQLNLTTLRNTPLTPYSVRLVLQDPETNACQSLPIGGFTTSLTGSGQFLALTPDGAFDAFKPPATPDYKIWVEASPVPGYIADSLVSAPIACHQNFNPTPSPDDCPNF